MTHQDPAPFDITPEEISMRMHNYWLEGINKGVPQLVTGLLPYLEMIAVEKLEAELDILMCEPPSRLKVLNPLECWWASEPGADMRTVEEIDREHDASRCDQVEKWRLWWLNEATQNCDIHHPISRAGSHLSGVGQAAVNVLIIGSEIREAIEHNKAEKSAALGVLLMGEVMQGGLFTVFEKAHETQKKRHAKGIGSEAKDMATLKKAAVNFAQKEWKLNPEKRIGEVADEFLIKAKPLARQLPNLMAWPKPLTVKTWIRNGITDIPKSAQRRGRPPSLKN